MAPVNSIQSVPLEPLIFHFPMLSGKSMLGGVVVSAAAVVVLMDEDVSEVDGTGTAVVVLGGAVPFCDAGG